MDQFVGEADSDHDARIRCAHALQRFGSYEDLLARLFPDRNRIRPSAGLLVAWFGLCWVWSVVGLIQGGGSGRGSSMWLVVFTSVLLVGGVARTLWNRSARVEDAELLAQACWSLRTRTETAIGSLGPLVARAQAHGLSRSELQTLLEAVDRLSQVLARPWSPLEAPRWREPARHNAIAEFEQQLTSDRSALQAFIEDGSPGAAAAPSKDGPGALSPMRCHRIHWRTDTSNGRQEWLLYDGSNRPVGAIVLDNPRKHEDLRRSWRDRRYRVVDSAGRVIFRFGRVGTGREVEIAAPGEGVIGLRRSAKVDGSRTRRRLEVHDLTGATILQQVDGQVVDADGTLMASRGESRGRTYTIHPGKDEPIRRMVLAMILFPADGHPQSFDSGPTL